jgi:excisionase family DNA binding protein
MTDYEMRKLAKMQAEYLMTALKSDDELLDLMYPPRLMNIEEAAEYLRIPVGTLYQKANEIPHEKVGKRLIFSDRGLIRWMKRSCRDVAVEIPMSKAM